MKLTKAMAKEAETVLSQDEQDCLRRLLESAPLPEMAGELGDYYKRLRRQGFRKWQAWNLTCEVHAHLCEKIFGGL